MKSIIIALYLSGTPASSVEPAAPPQAVLESSPEKGFRLSETAQKTLEVETQPTGAVRLDLPDAAVVRSEDRIGIYRLRGGWFKLVPARIVGKSGGRTIAVSSELTKGDRVVVKGAGLLRVAEMAIEGDAE